MKRALSIFLIMGLVFAVSSPVLAQRGGKSSKADKKEAKEAKKREKEEKKAWKKKAKNYTKSPLTLKNDLDNLQNKNKKLGDEISALEKDLAKANDRADSLQALMNAKNSELASVTSKFEKLQAAYEAQKNINEKGIIPGLVYKVQIGAFVHFDINSYLKETENFEGESQDGMNKYTIGAFRDIAIAENFKKDIQKMGIRDAWIVPYIDGVRVTMDEAVNYLDKQGS